MSVDKLVDSTQLDSDLTSVADAIRTKGGTSAQLAFPAGFVSAIDAIPTGGGGTQELYDFIEGNNSGTFKPDGLTKIRAGAFYRDTQFSVLHFPDVTSVGTRITEANNVVVIIVFEKAFSLDGATNMTFYGTGAQLTTYDLYSFPSTMGGSNFANSNGVNTMILRSPTLVALPNINFFNNTCFKSGGTGGTLYVPASLVSSYQSASNWSTILGYTNNQIKSIESTHTDPTAPIDLTLYYADGTPISA